MALKIIVSHHAYLDVEEATLWYAKRQKGLGRKFYKAFFKQVKILEKSPTIFPVEFPPFRKMTMKKFPVIVYYVPMPHEEKIVIAAVWHTKRNPDLLRKRLNVF